ncbi:MAG TPA: glycosyltransferase, partial [Silvibacterium sp.]|nr:glycosyltransferase [Silvibacterium sp.]
SLLIPFPLAADDHQRKNADVFVEAGAARMLLEADLTPGLLLDTLTSLLADRKLLESMSARSRPLAHADATSRIVSVIAELAR